MRAQIFAPRFSACWRLSKTSEPAPSPITMWKKGAPHHKQCEGCTHSQAAMSADVCAYLAARDVTYAVFSLGPLDEILAYRDFM